MAASQVQICNIALSTYLGVAPITALAAGTPAGEQCLLHYEDALQELFEAYRWSFATKRLTLSELTNDRSSEWDYKYTRPPEALSVHWVNELEAARLATSTGQSPDAPRETTSSVVYTDAPTAVMAYTQILTDPTVYPTYFSSALSASLAARMAIPLTEDRGRASDARQMFVDLLDKAIVLDERDAFITIPDHLPHWIIDRGVS